MLASVEKLTQKLAATESRLDSQSRVADDMRERLAKQEELLAKMRADAAYVQLLLENLATSVEKEKGLVSEHTEQLRFFAHHSRAQRSEGSSRSLYYIAVTWLYTPFLLFLKGAWLIVQPLVMTLRSLSLFNSAVLLEQQQTDETTDPADEDGSDDQLQPKQRRGGAATSLLSKLQQGALDPPRAKR